MLVDTHCHLGDAAYDADRADVVVRAAAEGVGHVVVVGESVAAADRALELAASCASLSATAGVHPHAAADWTADAAAWMEQRLADPRVVAAGEMGLDYHYDYSSRDVQRRIFDTQLDIAASAGRPAIIHAREADDDVAAALRSHPRTRAILHSFSSGMPLFHTAIELGHYISFSGMVTFRSWTLDDAVRETPLDRLLVETDGPYLAPVPLRGRRNEPAFVVHVARRVAVVRGMAEDELTAAVTANAVRLFGARLAPTQERS